MRSESTYLAAPMVSVPIRNHFEQHLNAAKERGEQNLTPAPDAQMIECIIDVAFWASLRREEGNETKVSLAFIAPEQASQSLRFAHHLPLRADILTKLSPGVERPGVYLGIWHHNGELFIWGTTYKIPDLCFVLDVSEPGLLVIKHRRNNGFGKFTNVAVLIGDQVKIIDERYATLPDSPTVVRSLLGINASAASKDSSNVLIQLAVSMRAHKHGGTLLIVPSGSDRWRESIIHPVKYSASPSYAGLADLIKKDISERMLPQWQSALRSEVESLGGLTAVDGATILTDQYELEAFGAKIVRPEGNARVEKILVHEPIIGDKPIITDPALSGGTRHLSAAQFVHDQRDSLALVASQDGHFTIFTWHPAEEIVQAYRIDTLLL